MYGARCLACYLLARAEIVENLPVRTLGSISHKSRFHCFWCFQQLARSSETFFVWLRNKKKLTSRRSRKRAWRRPRRLKNCLWRRLRARIPLETDFGPILDSILGGVLRSKSSLDGTRSRVQGSICLQHRFGIVLTLILR